MQEAQRIGIIVAPDEVDQAYGSIATRVKLSPSEFTQALQQLGVNPATPQTASRGRSFLAQRGSGQIQQFRAYPRPRHRDGARAQGRRAADDDRGSHDPGRSSSSFPRTALPTTSASARPTPWPSSSSTAAARRPGSSRRTSGIPWSRRTCGAVWSRLGPLVTESLKGVPVNGITAPNETETAAGDAWRLRPGRTPGRFRSTQSGPHRTDERAGRTPVAPFADRPEAKRGHRIPLTGGRCAQPGIRNGAAGRHNGRAGRRRTRACRTGVAFAGETARIAPFYCCTDPDFLQSRMTSAGIDVPIRVIDAPSEAAETFLVRPARPSGWPGGQIRARRAPPPKTMLASSWRRSNAASAMSSTIMPGRL